MIRTMLAVALTAASLSPATRAQGPADGVAGEWQSAGYGTMLKITRDPSGKRRLARFNSTSISCLDAGTMPEVRDNGGKVSFGSGGHRELVVRPAGDHAFLHVLGTFTDIRLTRPDRKPACPFPVPSDSPSRRLLAFDIFWRTLAENYPPYPHRPVDWGRAARDRAALERDNTDNKLDSLLRRFVRDLGDMHTVITWKGDGTNGLRPGTRDAEDIDENKAEAVIERRLGTRPTRVIDGVRYATGLPGGLGYLQINRLEGFGGDDGSYDSDREKFIAALDTVFARGRQDRWKGLILDMRRNEGGYDPLDWNSPPA